MSVQSNVEWVTFGQFKSRGHFFAPNCSWHRWQAFRQAAAGTQEQVRGQVLTRSHTFLASYTLATWPTSLQWYYTGIWPNMQITHTQQQHTCTLISLTHLMSSHCWWFDFVRTVPEWNSLPKACINADTVTAFQTSLRHMPWAVCTPLPIVVLRESGLTIIELKLDYDKWVLFILNPTNWI